jgi:hypothetical protein
MEVPSRHEFDSTAKARAVVIDWCYGFYNHQRRHSAAAGQHPSTTRTPPSAEQRHRERSTISGGNHTTAFTRCAVRDPNAPAETIYKRSRITARE